MGVRERRGMGVDGGEGTIEEEGRRVEEELWVEYGGCWRRRSWVFFFVFCSIDLLFLFLL